MGGINIRLLILVLRYIFIKAVIMTDEVTLKVQPFYPNYTLQINDQLNNNFR